MSKKKITGVAMAACVAGAFAVAAPAMESAATHCKLVHCAGVNSCKGTSSCKTKTHACKGLNSCKGMGYVKVPEGVCDRLIHAKKK